MSEQVTALLTGAFAVQEVVHDYDIVGHPQCNFHFSVVFHFHHRDGKAIDTPTPLSTMGKHTSMHLNVYMADPLTSALYSEVGDHSSHCCPRCKMYSACNGEGLCLQGR